MAKSTYFQISSSAFDQGELIPAKYTADGSNISPPLSWTDPPRETLSLALILDDPDARLPGGFTHWVWFNVPANQTKLPESIPPTSENLPIGGVHGANGRGNMGYMGPAPPPGSGTHLYRFNLYALNVMLDLKPGASKDDLLSAMGGHMIGNALLTGIYSR